MSSWPFTFEAEAELEEELRRRRWQRPWPVRRPIARPYRRPIVYPAPVFREPVYLEPPPLEPIEEPVEPPPEEEPAEEIHISRGCTAELERGLDVNAGDVYDEKATLPAEPGLYVIRSGTRPLYVGIAEKSIHSRFQQRYKALRDFGLSSAVLSGVKVSSYALKSTDPACLAGRKAKRGVALTNISPKEGLLRVLEQHFIKHFNTQKPPGGKYGNSGSEGYTFKKGQKVIMQIANRDATDPPDIVT